MSGAAQTVAMVAGLGLVAEVLRRHVKRVAPPIPAQVSSAAERILAGLAVDPCGGPAARDRADDFTRFYIAQKQVLIGRFGGTTERVCAANGFGACVPNPFKQVPTAPAGCTLKVAEQWIGVARRLADEASTVESLRDDLVELGDALSLQAALVRGMPAAGPTESDVNGRVWSTIGRLSIALAGVHINHGDAEREAAAELGDTLFDPVSYLNVVADVAGGAAGVVLRSNLSTVLVLAGGAYLTWRFVL